MLEFKSPQDPDAHQACESLIMSATFWCELRDIPQTL